MHASLNVFAGGGGAEEDEAEVLSGFASRVRPGGRVLHIPWAQSDPTCPPVHEWASATLRSLGIAEVATAASVRPITAGLDEYDGLFIGGGNTYLLLHRLRETGLDLRLGELIRGGMPCYGGSAGAIVLGAHIGTCAHMDENDVGIADLTGLNLFSGYAVWCHYTRSDTAAVKGFVAETGLRVASLPENAGLTHGPDGVAAIGPGEVLAWDGVSASRVVPRAV